MMSERVSVLTPIRADCPSVTINIAVNKIVIPSSVAAVKLFPPDPSLEYFTAGDNLLLLSAGYYIPAGITLLGPPAAGVVSPVMIARFTAYKFVSASSVAIPNFGVDGNFKIPAPNSEIAFGGFLDSSALIGDEKFRLEIEFPFPFAGDTWYVSMAGVSPMLNGEEIYIVPFVKVMHTLPMIV